jgi:hypothetical protein
VRDGAVLAVMHGRGRDLAPSSSGSQGMLAMSARSSLRGPAFGGHGPAGRLRTGQLMDGRRSRACRSAGQARHPFGVR